MEEPCEVHSEDNKALPEKNKKRRLKTPSQVEALEKFYSAHRYPSEEMKAELAESIGLTEKQVSGWFCHRRLKDKKYIEASANGRQDRSSVVIQDRGSGLRQDSCGSTKQGDSRHVDPREVESRRFSGLDFSAAELAYERERDQNGNSSDMDDTSSESSLPLQQNFHAQIEDPFDMTASRYLPHSGKIAPIDNLGARTRTGPSGYLKVKGQVENAAITAVKRQLGRHYREDGPPLGVEFDPLPPGAFESSIQEPDNGPLYLGDSNLPDSPDVPRIRDQPESGFSHEVYNSKINAHDLGLGRQRKPKPLLPSHGNPFPGQNPLLEMDESSAREMSVYDGTRLYKMRADHNAKERGIDSVSSDHRRPYGCKVASGHTEPWLDGTDDSWPAECQREGFESKHSNVGLKRGGSLGLEDRGLSRRMNKEDKFYGKRRAINEYSNSSRVIFHPTNEMRVGKRDPEEFPQQRSAMKASVAETPWTNQIKGSAAEIPSSFSEDETAETSSSMD